MYKRRGKKVIKWPQLLVMLLIILTCTSIIRSELKSTEPAKVDMSYKVFKEELDKGNVKSVVLIKNQDTMNITLENGKEYCVVNADYDEFKKDLLEAGVDMSVSKSTLDSAIANIVIQIPMSILLIILVVMCIRYITNSATTMFKVTKAEKEITFKDVAGMSNTKAEVQFAVDNLINYNELAKSGARPCKGIILEGPPGTGKTLLARAIAGEAKVPFISTSGSDFIEMFAGLGAARVRALWQLAITNAPCVVFIDEIDAVGRRRQTANSGAMMESNQTLNALLQKMDGLGRDTGILVIGATNMIEDLDPALVRPGRFDKKLYVGPPKTKEDRDEIISVHLKNKKLKDGLSLDSISKLMFGMTGAEIEQTLNEAVIISFGKGRGGVIDAECIDEAVMKLITGGVPVHKHNEEDIKIAAYHEAGHAVMMKLLGRKVTKISILPYSSGVGGMTQEDTDDKISNFKTSSELKDDIMIALGGMVAEEIVLGVHSNGCSNDLERATDIAVKMISVYGMGENLVSLRTLHQLNIDDGYFKEVANEANKLIHEIKDEVIVKLNEEKEEIERLGKELMKKETIIGYNK